MLTINSNGSEQTNIQLTITQTINFNKRYRKNHSRKILRNNNTLYIKIILENHNNKTDQIKM